MLITGLTPGTFITANAVIFTDAVVVVVAVGMMTSAMGTGCIPKVSPLRNQLVGNLQFRVASLAYPQPSKDMHRPLQIFDLWAMDWIHAVVHKMVFSARA